MDGRDKPGHDESAMQRESKAYTAGEIGRVRGIADFLPAPAELRRKGSDNVFADLGLPNPEQELLKRGSRCKSTRSSRRAG